MNGFGVVDEKGITRRMGIPREEMAVRNPPVEKGDGRSKGKEIDEQRRAKGMRIGEDVPRN